MAEQDEQKKEVIQTGNSLVFISHDTRDAKLAEAFSTLLKNVSAGVLKSFRTSDRKGNQGIDYGTEWFPEIIENIQNASDVVCLLTERSVDRPWILFEAGMARGKLETPILGVALGISLEKASSGPFAQFHNCGDDEESLTKLVIQLVNRIPNSEPVEDVIKIQVGQFKDIIEKILKANNEDAVAEPSELSGHDNSSAKLFEEIKVMFQDLPSRIEYMGGNDHRKSQKKRRIHPMLINDITHQAESGKVGILVCLSLFREGAPWLYEVGIDTLRTIDSNSSLKEKEKSFTDFKNLIEMSSRLPMNDLWGFEDAVMLLEEMPHVLIRSMRKYMDRNSNEES